MDSTPEKWTELIVDPRWKELKTSEDRNVVRLKWMKQVMVPKLLTQGYDRKDIEDTILWFLPRSDADIYYPEIRTPVVDKNLKHIILHPDKAAEYLSNTVKKFYAYDPKDPILESWSKDIGQVLSGFAMFIPDLGLEIGTAMAKLKDYQQNGNIPDWKDIPVTTGLITAPIETAARLGEMTRPIAHYMLPSLIDKATPEEAEKAKQILKQTLQRPVSTTLSIAIPYSIGKRVFTGTYGVVSSIKSEPATPTQFKGSRINIQDIEAQKVRDFYQQQREAVAKSRHKSLKSMMGDMNVAIYDMAANIKLKLDKAGTAGIAALVEHDLMRGSTSRAVLRLEDYKSDIFNPLNKLEMQELNDLRQSLRSTEIAEYKPEIKSPGGSPEAHKAYIAKSEDMVTKNLGKGSWDKIMVANDKVRLAFAENLERLLHEGLIDTKGFNQLMEYADYNPRKFIQYLDPEGTEYFGGSRPISVTKSGIQKLEEGSLNYLENDVGLLLSEAVVRVENIVGKNKANQALFRFSKEQPENGFVKPIINTDEKIPADWTKIGVMVDGKKQDMIIRNDMAKEWIKQDPQVTQELAQLMRVAGGGIILRPMATGMNPEFAIANFFRDTGRVFQVAMDPYGKQVYSPHLPVFLTQIGKDLIDVLPDVLQRKGKYKDYMKEGGGMEFLTMQGRPFKAPIYESWAGGLQKVLEYAGMTSELWVRLALRERGLKNGLTPSEATWTARSYLDFGLGGSLIKAVDNAVPYLNANVQGTRGVIRAAIKDPVSFTYKTMQIMALEAGIYHAAHQINPEAWNAISNRQKEANWVIPMPYSFKDKDGNARYHYVAIPKDQGQRIFSTIARIGMERYFEGKMPIKKQFDELKMAVGDFLPPVTAMEYLPPLVEGIVGYSLNKDIYFKEDIWKGEPVKKWAEYTQYTPEIYKGLGETTGTLSPMRTEYLVNQLLTERNIYKDLMGLGYKTLTGATGNPETENMFWEHIRKAPFARKLFKVTYPGQTVKEDVERLSIEENTRRKLIADDLYNYLREDNMDAVRKLVKENPADYEWMESRVKNWKVNKGKNIELLELIGEPAVVRARYVFDKWSALPESQQSEFLNEVGNVKGLTLDKFGYYFNRFRRDYENKIKSMRSKDENP